MKIYTRKGDLGMTSPFSGERIRKSHPQICVCGDIDELNAYLGMLLVHLSEHFPESVLELSAIQSDLFSIGTCLAEAQALLTDAIYQLQKRTKDLETVIDRLSLTLPTQTSFLLPGGHETAAWAHIARSVCRRAERSVVALIDRTEIPSDFDPRYSIVAYLNRLSDYLYTLARYCNYQMRVPEREWKVT